MSEVQIDGRAAIRDLRRLEFALQAAAVKALETAVSAAGQDARATTLFRDRTGETRHSIDARITGLTGFVLAGGAAKFLENGTPPHNIVARRAKMLRFEVNGQTIFRRMVRHPGTAERPFMAHAQVLGEKVADYAGELYAGQAIAAYTR